MAAKLTCPECDKTLTLAKAPTPGKKVRCPRCQAVFPIPAEDGELVEDEERAPQKKAAIKKGGPAKASPKPAAPPPPAPKKPAGDDEDDDGGTYGFKMNAEEEEEREKTKLKIDYAPDVTTKDPRGKAVAILAKPSSYVIINGGLTAVAGLVVFVMGLWPFIFAETVASTKRGVEVSQALEKLVRDESSKGKAAGPKIFAKLKKDIIAAEELEDIARLVDPLLAKVKPAEEFITAVKISELETSDKVAFRVWQVMEDRETITCIWRLVIGFLILLYGSVMAFAGVKMQTLESYTWAMVGPIMGIVLGIGGVIYFAILLIGQMELEDAGALGYIQMTLAILYNFGAIAVSAWGLKTILEPDIKAAFEYDPEKEPEENTDEGEEEDEEEVDEEDEE